LTQPSTESLISEIERLKRQCEGLYQSASNNAQSLIISEAKVESLLTLLRDAHSMLLWCERLMMSPSISTYPKDLALKIERIINDVPSV
jgi:hypothetical protein